MAEQHEVGHRRIGGLTGWPARAVIAAALAALVFEQSPANEALRTAVGLSVLDRTSNELVVGAVVAGLTMVIEGVAGLLIVAGLQTKAGLVHRLVERIRARTDATALAPSAPAGDGSRTRATLTDLGIALGVGAGLVVVRHHLRTGAGLAVRDAVRLALVASLAVAAVSGLIGVLAAGGIEHADRVGLGTPARWFVDYATDWRFWLVVLVAVQAGALVRRRLARRRTPAIDAR